MLNLKKLLWITTFCWQLIPLNGRSNYFCNLRCNSDTAPCYREPCPRSRTCGKHFSMIKLSDELKNYILQMHNDVRHSVAEGIFHQIPPASNMNFLSYNDELEFAAQCWANNCKLVNDVCITTKQFRFVSQNLALIMVTNWTEGDSDYMFDVVTSAFCNNWLHKISKYNSDMVTARSEVRLESAQALTNMICDKTTHLGCAAVKFGNSMFSRILFVCNYGPYTCLAGRPLYKVGSIGTQCPEKKFAKNGLCISKIVIDENWKPPYEITATATAIQATIIKLLMVLIVTQVLYV